MGTMSSSAESRPRELPGLTAQVLRVGHVPTADAPPHRPHKFSYHIAIQNNSLRIVTVFQRKWVITNARGHRLVVEGDGVVGQFPRLAPGDQFQYNSYHLVDSSSTAEGAYLARDEEGEVFIIRIPSFTMEVES